MKMKYNIPKRNSIKNGFTVIELLLSISIAGIALMALASATPIMMYQVNYARQKSTATYLAQEGVELIKSVRDHNSMSGVAWNYQIDGSRADNEVDYTYPPGNPTTAWTGTGTFLRLNNQGFYCYNGGAGTQTVFKRKVTLTLVTPAPPGSEYLDVKVTVSWTDKYGLHNIVVEDYLYPYWTP